MPGVNIYLKDSEFREYSQQAEDAGVGLGKFLVGRISGNQVGKTESGVMEILKRIESKFDNVLKRWDNAQFCESTKPLDAVSENKGKISVADKIRSKRIEGTAKFAGVATDVESAQKLLEKRRKKEGKPVEQSFDSVKARISLEGEKQFFNPQPKKK